MNKTIYNLPEGILEGVNINVGIKVFKLKEIIMMPKTKQIEAYFKDQIVFFPLYN